MFACIYIPNYAVQAAGYGKNAEDALLDCAAAWSPRVEHTEQGVTTLDIDGLERLFGSYAEIAKTLSAKVGELGFTARIGVASNPDAAIHAAKGFQGLTVLPCGLEAERLRNLPISILTPDEKTQEILDRWGIRTFGALADLPLNGIAVRLGDCGVRLHRLARGCEQRVLSPRKAPLRFVESMEFDYEITLLEPLAFILARLLGQICSRLKCRGLVAHEIHLTLGPAEAKYAVRLPIPTQDSKLLLKLLQLDLEAHPPQAAISEVALEAIHAHPRIAQLGLYVPLSPEPGKLELTLARIAAIVGAENVGSAELLDSHRPGAFRMRRFVVDDEYRGVGHLGSAARLIAFRTFRPPLESTVEIQNGRPQWIAFAGAHGPIVSACGPWRTSGDWWTAEPWNRDEWDIAMSSAGHSTLYRIYCDRARRRWFVEGIYD